MLYLELEIHNINIGQHREVAAAVVDPVEGTVA